MRRDIAHDHRAAAYDGARSDGDAVDDGSTSRKIRARADPAVSTHGDARVETDVVPDHAIVRDGRLHVEDAVPANPDS
jgi:hypothetical protein